MIFPNKNIGKNVSELKTVKVNSLVEYFPNKTVGHLEENFLQGTSPDTLTWLCFPTSHTHHVLALYISD